MIINKIELMKLNIKNLNDRIYIKKSFDNINLNIDYFGQIGQDSEFQISKITHKITDIQISSDGNSLIGNIEIYSDILIDNIDGFIFRPRSIGSIEEGIVNINKIISFDAVPYTEDSWYGIDPSDDNLYDTIFISNDFTDHLKKRGEISILIEYMDYHLMRMDPSFYKENDTISLGKDIFYYKNIYDICLLCMSSTTIEPDYLLSLINGMIRFYENKEDYEKCSILNEYLKNLEKEIENWD